MSRGCEQRMCEDNAAHTRHDAIEDFCLADKVVSEVK